MFLNAHSGFSRDDLQNYLNLYSFVINPPSDHLEKVEKIIKMVFENPKSLKYSNLPKLRDFIHRMQVGILTELKLPAGRTKLY